MKQAYLTLFLSILVLSLLLAAGCTDREPASVPATPTPPGPTGTIAPPAVGYPETSQDIKDYVDYAAVWAIEHGRDEAIAAFGNATGPFVTGDVYVYALDYEGIALALPFQPAMVGTDFTPLLDASGKPFTAVEIQLVKSGGGYILYHYPYPADDQPSMQKLSYVRPVDDTYWIGAGIYTSEDRLIDPALRQFLADAKAYAVANGREKALAAFNNLSGPFIDGELYVFAYDYEGNVLSWPHRPDQIGVNRYNVTDPMGIFHIQSFITTAKRGGGVVDYYTTNPFTNATDLKVSWVTDVDGTWLIGAGRYIVPGPLVLRA